MANFGKRVDANQKLIVRELERLDISVEVLSNVGEGCPDLCIGILDKYNFFAEVKMPGKVLNERQQEWHSEWRGQKMVVTYIIDVLTELSNYALSFNDLDFQHQVAIWLTQFREIDIKDL